MGRKAEETAGGQKPSGERSKPKGSAKPAERRRFRIEIYDSWCKSCGICVAFCPRKCLSTNEDGSPLISAPENCNGCGFCEIHCPDFAISVREQREHEDNPEEDEEAV